MSTAIYFYLSIRNDVITWTLILFKHFEKIIDHTCKPSIPTSTWLRRTIVLKKPSNIYPIHFEPSTKLFLQALLEDPHKKWGLYEAIFEASGLSRKHRGIIIQLALTHTISPTSQESLRFLRVFTENTSSRLG